MLPLLEPGYQNGQVKVQQANSCRQKGKNCAYNCSSPLNMKQGQRIDTAEMLQRNNNRNNQADGRKNDENNSVFT